MCCYCTSGLFSLSNDYCEETRCSAGWEGWNLDQMYESAKYAKTTTFQPKSMGACDEENNGGHVWMRISDANIEIIL